MDENITKRMYNRARNKTENSLKELIKKNGYQAKFYYDQISEYMLYYDSLYILNKKMKENSNNSQYFDCLKEKRQVTKEMRNILSFLKLEPVEIGDPGNGSQDEL